MIRSTPQRRHDPAAATGRRAAPRAWRPLRAARRLRLRASACAGRAGCRRSRKVAFAGGCRERDRRHRMQRPCACAAAGAEHAAPLSEFAAGANPLRAGSAPLLVLAGRLRGQIAQRRRRKPAPPGHPGNPHVRGACAPARSRRPKTCWPRATRCARSSTRRCSTRRGARRATGQGSPCSSRSTRSLGRREVLPDPGSRDPASRSAISRCSSCCTSCLALGFEGKYRLDERGQCAARRDSRRACTGASKACATARSGALAALERRGGPAQRRRPLRAAVGRGGGVRGAARRRLHLLRLLARLLRRAGERARSRASASNRSMPVVPASPNAPTSGCASCWRRQIAAGCVSVEETGERTLITLTVHGPVRFRQRERQPAAMTSCCAKYRRGAEARARQRAGRGPHRRSAAALVPFKDNYELSRARAAHVADLIRGSADGCRRVEAAGKGSLEPRYSRRTCRRTARATGASKSSTAGMS